MLCQTLHRFFKPFSSALQTLVEPLSKDHSRPSNDLIWVERRFLKFEKSPRKCLHATSNVSNLSTLLNSQLPLSKDLSVIFRNIVSFVYSH